MRGFELPSGCIYDAKELNRKSNLYNNAVSRLNELLPLVKEAESIKSRYASEVSRYTYAINKYNDFISKFTVSGSISLVLHLTPLVAQDIAKLYSNPGTVSKLFNIQDETDRFVYSVLLSPVAREKVVARILERKDCNVTQDEVSWISTELYNTFCSTASCTVDMSEGKYSFEWLVDRFSCEVMRNKRTLRCIGYWYKDEYFDLLSYTGYIKARTVLPVVSHLADLYLDYLEVDLLNGVIPNMYAGRTFEEVDELRKGATTTILSKECNGRPLFYSVNSRSMYGTVLTLKSIITILGLSEKDFYVSFDEVHCSSRVEDYTQDDEKDEDFETEQFDSVVKEVECSLDDTEISDSDITEIERTLNDIRKQKGIQEVLVVPESSTDFKNTSLNCPQVEGIGVIDSDSDIEVPFSDSKVVKSCTHSKPSITMVELQGVSGYIKTTNTVKHEEEEWLGSSQKKDTVNSKHEVFFN